jgi:hypothetical protein
MTSTLATTPHGTTTPSPSPEVVLRLCHGHVAARVLHVIAELGVADVLGECPRTAVELAADLHVDADGLARALRLLEGSGVFRRDTAGCWHHTDASSLLRSDHPMSLRAFARMSGTPFNWDSVGHLDHSIRTGEPGIGLLDGGGWLAYLDAHPAERDIFQQAMTSKAHDDIAGVLDVHDFSRHSTVADVAGGRGHLLRAVLAACPTVSGVLFELPAVAAEVGPADRLTVVSGNFFTDPLPDCDAYLLMNVIHDWDDDRAIAVLTSVATAGHAGASVLVVETVLPIGPEPHYAKTLDVIMLAITGGRERTTREYRALFDAAGLDLASVAPTATAFSVIEAIIR